MNEFIKLEHAELPFIVTIDKSARWRTKFSSVCGLLTFNHQGKPLSTLSALKLRLSFLYYNPLREHKLNSSIQLRYYPSCRVRPLIGISELSGNFARLELGRCACRSERVPI